MTPARWMAVGASLVGASYAGGLLLGQLLFRRSVIYPR